MDDNNLMEKINWGFEVLEDFEDFIKARLFDEDGWDYLENIAQDYRVALELFRECNAENKAPEGNP
ncbi:MAG: hypothetical protein PHU95_05480 [Candidatus Thermoplasmatota archaeon]|nr:hypothetical protein [Candidatus Thermoplasmatota archaeon]MDD5778877.1 hypothetical protein [Candidatus Thermoplasmatota archaeon]